MTIQWRFGLFLAVALLQLAFPAKMIYDSTLVLRQGETYQFKTEPLDPADPFRGAYVALRFSIERFVPNSPHHWKRGQAVYVSLDRDPAGFARVKGISHKRPSEGDYVQASIRRARKKLIILNFPFQKFFLEANKASEAEAYYRKVGEGYAIVKVYQGKGMLEDVIVKGQSLKDL